MSLSVELSYLSLGCISLKCFDDFRGTRKLVE